jgi:hypothetical protein
VILYRSLPGEVAGRWLFVEQESMKWISFAVLQKRGGKGKTMGKLKPPRSESVK